MILNFQTVYEFLCLRKKLNRFLFILSILVLYWIVFWIVPAILIWSSSLSDIFSFLKIFFLSFINFFENIREIPSYITQSFSGYLYLWKNWSDFDMRFFYHYLIAPAFIVIPFFLIRKIIPNYNTTKLIFLSIITIILSFIYTYMYILSFSISNYSF